MHRTISKWTVCMVALLISAPGCVRRTPPPLESAARASLGTVGVLSVGPPPEGSINGPVGVGTQAMKGAAKGGGIGVLSGAGGGALLGLATGPFAPVFVPVFAAGGALGGLVLGGGIAAANRGINAIPAKSAERIRAALSTAIAGRDLQADIRHRIVTASDGAGKRLDLGGDATAVPSPVSNYVRFADLGAHTVLEVAIVDVGLRGKGGRDPDLTLTLSGRARLVSIPDNRVLWSNDAIVVESRNARLSEWTAEDSRLLCHELDRALEAFSRRIGDEALPRA